MHLTYDINIFSLNNKSHWLQVSASKLLGESGNIKMPNGFFGHNLQKRSKTEYRHRILRFQNGLGTKFQVKQTILDKLTQKRVFLIQKRKTNGNHH